MKRTLIVLSLLAAVVMAANLVSARSSYLNTFNSAYDTGNTRLDACGSCHGATKGIRNAYGLDMETELNAGASTLDSLLIIEGFDSDGDSYSNIDEISQLTFPGDAADFPSGSTCTDDDGDGYAIDGGECGAVDCNDNDPAVSPGAAESCTNGIDDDCDGLIDGQDPDATDCPLQCIDADGDSYAIDGGQCGTVDCDDGNPFVFPGQVEDCLNGTDDDCDGLVDGDDSDCGACVPSADNEKGKRCKDGIDNDCDGLTDAFDSDCGGDDTGGGGGEAEICDDGIDNDLDGKIDCADKKDCGKSPLC